MAISMLVTELKEQFDRQFDTLTNACRAVPEEEWAHGEIDYLVPVRLVFLLGACHTTHEGNLMGSSADERAISRIVADYSSALENGDPDLWERLFWSDDPHFSIVENDRPQMMGRAYIEFVSSLIRERGKQPPSQRWYETRVHVLGEQTAYSVSLRDEVNSGKTSRVTLIYMKRDGEWRIIHGHFSFVPE